MSLTESEKNRLFYRKGMKLMLLPGADGTGVLFTPFLECAKSTGLQSANIAIINLNTDLSGEPLDQTLSAQAKRIEVECLEILHSRTHTEINSNEINNNEINKSIEPLLIVAESYSGLLAYELLKRHNLNIAGVVFVASFIRCPTKLATLAPKLNPKVMKATLGLTPDHIWGRLLFGQWQTKPLRQLFKRALDETPNDLLKQRLTIIAEARTSDDNIDAIHLLDILEVPCLYLQASQDKLVARDNVEDFEKRFYNFESTVIEGTHFLLQTNPEAVIIEVLRFMSCLQGGLKPSFTRSP